MSGNMRKTPLKYNVYNFTFGVFIRIIYYLYVRASTCIWINSYFWNPFLWKNKETYPIQNFRNGNNAYVIMAIICRINKLKSYNDFLMPIFYGNDTLYKYTWNV